MCEIVVAKVTCPVVTLKRQGWSHEVSVHWLRTILSHLLLRGHVGRRGGFCIREEEEERWAVVIQFGKEKLEIIPSKILTWHLEWTAGVGAGWRMWKSDAAAASRRVWVAVSR